MGFNSIPQSSRPIIVGRVKDEYFYTGDTTQHFPIGTLYRPDERSFSYGMAGATLNSDLGCEPADYQHVGYVTVAEDTIVGATEVVIDVGAGHGAAADGVIGEDELFNGSIVIFDASSKAMNRRIVKNTATTGAGEMTVTMDHGLRVALVGNTDHAECVASRFLDVRVGASASKSIVGIPVFPATVGQFVWIQTWGPCWVAPQAAVGTGNNDRQVVFRHDGSVDQHDSTDAVVAMGQHAGWNMANAIGAGQGAPFIFLQISY